MTACINCPTCGTAIEITVGVAQANETPEVMNTRQAARYLGTSVRRLAALRRRGIGPAYLPLGRIQYTRSDLDKYRDACKIVPEMLKSTV